MDALIFILTLVACGISIASAVISAWFARKNNVRELESDVSEIASVVEKVYRESKRQQMRRVRQAAEDSEVPVPPGLVNNPTFPPIVDKNALRRKVFGGPQ